MEDEKPKTRTRHKVFFALSLIIALCYLVAYHRASIGVSPFHIGKRLPTVDRLMLFLFVILPLAIGILFGLLAGRMKWYVLAVYPVVILVSLI